MEDTSPWMTEKENITAALVVSIPRTQGGVNENQVIWGLSSHSARARGLAWLSQQRALVEPGTRAFGEVRR